MTSHKIQKYIVSATASLTTEAIVAEFKNELFVVLVDESRDASCKEQMAVVIRFVNKIGCVVEHFLGIVHVFDTTSRSLKAALESLFAKHALSLSSLHGQGYDGASNMQGEFNGLKSLILAENGSAFYVHYFAHQLQLTLVAVSKKHYDLASFFNYISDLLNVVGASCKRRDFFRESQREKVIAEIFKGDIKTRQGANQETALKRPGDTRWGSHFTTIVRLIFMFSSVVECLEGIKEDAKLLNQKGETNSLWNMMQSFEFIFLLHLMLGVLQALQRKDQDIVNAMTLVKISKIRLEKMRESGWDGLLNEVSKFCENQGVFVPKMEDFLIVPGRSQRRAEPLTNLYHFKVDLFNTVIDTQLQELDDRFTISNMKLLSCMARLDPSNLFRAFKKESLIEFARFYPVEFFGADFKALEHQLKNCILDVKSNDVFSNVKGICGLSQKLVELDKHITYHLVYLLVKLALILPLRLLASNDAFLP